MVRCQCPLESKLASCGSEPMAVGYSKTSAPISAIQRAACGNAPVPRRPRRPSPGSYRMRCSRARTRSPAAPRRVHAPACGNAPPPGVPPAASPVRNAAPSGPCRNTASRTTLESIRRSRRGPPPRGSISRRAPYWRRDPNCMPFGWPLPLQCSWNPASFTRSKRGWRTRAHELALFASGISKSVRNGTLEVVGIARGEHPGIPAHRQFDPTLDDDAALFTRMREHFIAGIGIGRKTLVQNRHAAFAQTSADQPQLYRARADVREFVLREEHLGLARKIQGEKVRKRHRDAVQDFFERTDGRAHPVLFDQRNQAVGDTGALRQLALRQAVHLPDRFQVDAYV